MEREKEVTERERGKEFYQSEPQYNIYARTI